MLATIGADKDLNTSTTRSASLAGPLERDLPGPHLNEWLGAATRRPGCCSDSGYNIARGGAEWLNRVNLEVRSELASNDANVWKGYARFTGGFAGLALQRPVRRRERAALSLVSA
ncbi:MAG: hypothetical protein ACLTSG_14590 [Lachnospiraceae bacterium]